MKITFIGAGNMSEAIVAGVIRQGVLEAGEVTVSDPLEERRSYMESTYGVTAVASNHEAVAGADGVVLAVKPQLFEAVWEELKGSVSKEALVMSIMAGVAAKRIEGADGFRVVRVMPNTPSLVGCGASGIAAGALATEADLSLAEKLMQAVGVSVRVQEEQLHAVTALSGSGPAYLFLMMEAMMAAAIELGLGEEEARLLCVETVGGAADLMADSDCSAATLRERVTSKGGTTAAALATFERERFRELVAAAMRSAYDRSQELA